MSSAPKISPSAPSVSTATQRVSGGGRGGLFSTAEKIQGLGGSPGVGNYRDSLWDRERSEFYFGEGRHREPDRPGFTSLVARFSLGYQANELEASNDDRNVRFFITDMVRGIGVYENNMRVIATSGRSLGVSVNYFS